MKLLDPFSLAAASSLARLAFLAPVRSDPTRNYVEHVKTAGCGTAVPPNRKRFPDHGYSWLLRNAAEVAT